MNSNFLIYMKIAQNKKKSELYCTTCNLTWVRQALCILDFATYCVTVADHFLPQAGYHRDGDSTGISDEE